MRSVVKKTLVAVVLVWLARGLLRRVAGLAVIAAVLVAAASVDVDTVRRTVGCDVGALHPAAEQLRDVATDAPQQRSSGESTNQRSLVARLARCHRDDAPVASSRTAR